MLTTRPLSEAIGTEITGVDLSRPVSDAQRQEIKELFNEAGVLVFRDQVMTKHSLVEAAAILGEAQIHPSEIVRDVEVPEIVTLATKGARGDIEYEDDPERVVGKQGWHNDMGYTAVPSRGAMLFGANLPPEGGLTGFADCAKAYNALSQAMQQTIENLHAIHSMRYAFTSPQYKDERALNSGTPIENQFPDVIYPLVFSHPESGRKILNAVQQWASDVVEIPGEEGWALLDKLAVHLTQSQFVYWHSYLPGDVVVWDNWRVNHAASGSKAKYARVMWRTTIKGTFPLGRPLDAGVSPSRSVWRTPGFTQSVD